MADLAEILAAKRPTTGTVDICLDPVLADSYHDAVRARDEAKQAMADAPTKTAALRANLADREAEVQDAEEALRGVVATFTLKALGRAEYEALKDDNPPTTKQVTAAELDGTGPLSWNPDTFPPLLVAACSADPEISVSDAQQMWKSPDWNAGELLELFWTAVGLQGSRRVPNLGKGSGPTRN